MCRPSRNIPCSLYRWELLCEWFRCECKLAFVLLLRFGRGRVRWLHHGSCSQNLVPKSSVGKCLYQFFCEEVMRESHFYCAGIVERGELLRGQLQLEARKIVLQLRNAAGADDGDDWNVAMLQPCQRDLRGRAPDFLTNFLKRGHDAVGSLSVSSER